MRSTHLMLIVFVLVAVSPLGVQAQNDSSDSQNQAREQRYSKYRADYPVRLDDAEKSNIVAKCDTVQANLRILRDRMDRVKTERQTIYGRVDKRLSSVQSRLGLQEIDTSIIDGLLVNYRKDVSAFDTLLTTYHQTLSDAIDIDCKANPDSFRSTIEAIRASRKKVADSADTIAALSTTTIKTGFESIEQRLGGASNGR